jgi:hypothetical protein
MFPGQADLNRQARADLAHRALISAGAEIFSNLSGGLNHTAPPPFDGLVSDICITPLSTKGNSYMLFI